MNDSNAYLISYDMAGDGDYEALFSHIKSYEKWAHVTESLWAIVTTKKAVEIRDEVKPYLTENSRLIVVKSANVAAWSNVICSSDWLKKNI